MTFGLAQRFVYLELEDVTEEVSDVRNVIRNVKLGSRIEVLLRPIHWGSNALDTLSVVG